MQPIDPFMSEPTNRVEIEEVLCTKYEAGELDTGLFYTGHAFVVMDNVDGEVHFAWFDEAVPLEQVQAAV